MFLSIFLNIKIQDLQLLRDLRYYVNCGFMAITPYKPGFDTNFIKTAEPLIHSKQLKPFIWEKFGEQFSAHNWKFFYKHIFGAKSGEQVYLFSY